MENGNMLGGQLCSDVVAPPPIPPTESSGHEELSSIDGSELGTVGVVAIGRDPSNPEDGVSLIIKPSVGDERII